MKRVLDRAAAWLIECGCLQDIRYATERNADIVYFRQKAAAAKSIAPLATLTTVQPPTTDKLKAWITAQSEGQLFAHESAALERGFGSELERRIVAEKRLQNLSILASGPIRQQYVQRFIEKQTVAALKAAVVA
jgi:hypothetical protein